MNMNSFETLQNEQVSGDSSTPRKINNLLNSSRSRFEGLQMLNFFLPQCSDEDFLQFCISWMQNCCKIDGLTRNKDYAIHLLNDLFKKSSNYHELKKSVSFFITTRYFDFFFKHFLHSQAGWSCTETCMLHYRGACGPFQENLEEHLKTEIGKSLKVSSTVAHCYALIPSVGGGGNEGICYKKNWRIWFVKFLSITHSLLNDLFADVNELQEYEMPEHVYDKSQNENSPTYLTIQIYNHCSILSCMLLTAYPAPKSIPTDLIFQLLCRGLAVTPKALAKRQTTDIISVTKVLPQIHCSFLSLLKAVIVTCKNQLLPYSHLVCKLIRQTLEWTEQELTDGNEKLFGQLRVSAYEVLCNWLTAARNGSCVEVISNVVISSAISDIMSKKKVVFLKEAKRQTQSKNREQKTRRINGAANDRLCHAALKVLQFLLKFAGALLKPEEHKFLQEVVVKSVLQVQRSVSDAVVPFAVPSCRLELYALLVELVLQPCPKWPPPTHFALRLLSRGLNDGCPQYNNGGFASHEAPERKSQLEVQLQWKKASAEAEHEDPGMVEEIIVDANDTHLKKGEKPSSMMCGEISQVQCTTAGSSESDDVGSQDKTGNADGESCASSNEDSRNTVTFLKTGNTGNSSNDEGEETKEMCSSEMSPLEEESSPKLRRTATESSPARTSKALESKLVESDQSEPASSSKSISPESASEEGQLRKRYFLRSKTKGSSEEPEEAIKRTVSLDSLKTTPTRGLQRGSSSVQPAAKRPRTRALSKIETNGGTEIGTPKKTPDDDDDEDILAAFNDSLAD